MKIKWFEIIWLKLFGKNIKEIMLSHNDHEFNNFFCFCYLVPSMTHKPGLSLKLQFDAGSCVWEILQQSYTEIEHSSMRLMTILKISVNWSCSLSKNCYLLNQTSNYIFILVVLLQYSSEVNNLITIYGRYGVH